MEINRTNYEVFVIDYLDNRLDPVQTAELLLFLENNPDLKEDFEELKAISVTPAASEVYGFKELLIQPSDKDANELNDTNYSHYFVAYLEGDLSNEGMEKITAFLHANPQLQSEFNLFASCRLTADKKIKFPAPEVLKVKTKSAFIRYYLATGIAASILLLGTVYLRLTPETDDSLEKSLRNAVEMQMSSDGESETTSPAKRETSDPALKTEEKTTVRSQTTGNSQTFRSQAKETIPAVKPAVRTEKSPAAPVRKLDRKPMFMNNTPIVANTGERNFYSGLYEDISLAQELSLSNLEEKEEALANQEKHPEKIGNVKAGRIINSVISSGEQLAEQLPQNMNGWLIADIGIKGFNLLTNKNYTINRSLSNKGSIKALKIEEEKL